MITNFTPSPYEGDNPLPTYATNVIKYELLANVIGGYTITLGRLFLGDSKSAGNPLAHALFESFTDHGERAAVVRTRANGFNRTSMAILNAMMGAGVEFQATIALAPESAMTALGEWFKAHNPEIIGYSLMSQSCH